MYWKKLSTALKKSFTIKTLVLAALYIILFGVIVGFPGFEGFLSQAVTNLFDSTQGANLITNGIPVSDQLITTEQIDQIKHFIYLYVAVLVGVLVGVIGVFTAVQTAFWNWMETNKVSLKNYWKQLGMFFTFVLVLVPVLLFNGYILYGITTFISILPVIGLISTILFILFGLGLSYITYFLMLTIPITVLEKKKFWARLEFLFALLKKSHYFFAIFMVVVIITTIISALTVQVTNAAFIGIIMLNILLAWNQVTNYYMIKEL